MTIYESFAHGSAWCSVFDGLERKQNHWTLHSALHGRRLRGYIAFKDAFVNLMGMGLRKRKASQAY